MMDQWFVHRPGGHGKHGLPARFKSMRARLVRLSFIKLHRETANQRA